MNADHYQIFKYINKKDDDEYVPSTNDASHIPYKRQDRDILECSFPSVESLNGKFLTRKDTVEQYYLFWSLDGYIKYLNKAPIEERNYHEMIFSWHKQKLKFDIDAELEKLDKIKITEAEYTYTYPGRPVPTGDTFDDTLGALVGVVPLTPRQKAMLLLDKVITAIIETFAIHYFIMLDPSDIIVCSSINPDGTENTSKYSYHVIIDHYYVVSNDEAKVFTKLVLNCIEPKYKLLRIIDAGINKRLQSFRLLGNQKHGSNRIKQVIDHANGDTHYRDPLTVKYKDTIVQHIAGCKQLPSLMTLEQQEKQQQAIIAPKGTLSQADLDQVLKKTSEYWSTAYKYRDATESIISFDRLRPAYCMVCDRVHDKENSFYIVYYTDRGIITMYAKCRCDDSDQSIPAGQLVMTDYKEDLGVDPNADDADTPVNEQVIERVKVIYNERLIKGTITKVSASNDLYLKSEFDTLPTIHQNIYVDPDIRDFEYVDTLCIKAHMGMGKTKKLITYLDKYYPTGGLTEYKIVVLAFRRTFASHVKKRLDNFVLYSDVKGMLSAKRVIVQMESLDRYDLTGGDYPDLVIMDESESIIEQIDSGLARNHGDAIAKFVAIIRYSKRIIAMDAHLSDRTYHIINKLRIEPRNQQIEKDNQKRVARPNKHQQLPLHITFHCNKYKNSTRDTYHFTTDRNRWFHNIFTAVADKKKIAVPTSSLIEAEILKEMLKRRDHETKIGFYSSKTSASIKREHFGNVAEYWSQYDVLIFTPTVSAGVSYEEKRFNEMYGFFSDQSCNVEVCLQMLGRVRDIQDRNYFICFDASRGSLPIEIEQIDKFVRQRVEDLYQTNMLTGVNTSPHGSPSHGTNNSISNNLLTHEYNETGSIVYHDSMYYKIWLENIRVRFLSQNNFIQRFISYVAETGAKVAQLGGDVDRETIAAIGKERLMYKNQIQEVNADMIAKSRELTEQEASSIGDKLHSDQYDVTPEDYNAYQKYLLRRHYAWIGTVTKQFVLIYGKPKAKTIFRNISTIMQLGDLRKGVAEVKMRERTYHSYVMQDEGTQYKDISKQYMFRRHDLAVFLLTDIFGFSTLTDKKLKHNEAIYSSMYSNREKIAGKIREIVPEMSARLKNFRESDFTNPRVLNKRQYVDICLRTINKVLSDLYDIKVTWDKADPAFVQLSSNKLFNIGDSSPDKSKPTVVITGKTQMCY
jgi:hypothetical protein